MAGSALVVVLAATITACGGDDDPETTVPTITAPPTTASTTPATTEAPTTTLTPAEQDEADIRALAEAWFQVSREVTAQIIGIEESEKYLVDPYLAGFKNDQLKRRAEGKSARLGVDSRHVVVGINVDGESAVVEECVVDGDVLLGAGDEVLDDNLVTTSYETTAVRTTSGWRFEQRVRFPVLEGDECPGS